MVVTEGSLGPEEDEEVLRVSEVGLLGVSTGESLWDGASESISIASVDSGMADEGTGLRFAATVWGGRKTLGDIETAVAPDLWLDNFALRMVMDANVVLLC